MNHLNLPHDPDEYVHTKHFKHDILPRESRCLTKELVNKTIQNGDDAIRSNGDTRIRRKLTVDGVEVVVVLGSRDDPAIITAWTEVDSITDALQSDRWSQGEIESIEQTDHKQNEDSNFLSA